MTTEAGGPHLECDLVMKGGVTSGIIYPAAIAAIASTYRLRSIGGTSAGAIGAAAAAAMQFGLLSGRNPGAREQLARLSRELGEKDGGKPLLLRLFEPDADTAGLFHFLQRLAAAAGSAGKAGVARLLLQTPFLWVSLGVSLLAAVLLILLSPPLPTLGDALLIIALLCTLIPLGTLAAGWFYWAPRLRKDLAATAANGFGFCSGMAQYDAGTAKPSPSLSGWLHDQFQSLAGLTPDDAPLTFGDLWVASKCRPNISGKQAMAAVCAAVEDKRPDLVARDIELALVASDISRAQTVQLPFMRREDRLFARIGDLRTLFPDAVVAWMIANQREPRSDDELADVDLGGISPEDLIRLPYPQDMPVIFAVRMSLSFPFLFKAVRLYVIRRKREADGAPGREEMAEIWLADGGITSNFPIHLFDAPIPTRPTFCINLVYHDDELAPDWQAVARQATRAERAERKGLHDASGAPEELVFMLRTNGGRLSPYSRFGETDPGKSLLRFAGQVVTTARQWGDNQLIDVPGYRDRIVHVRMKADEGGFNLGMDGTKIEDLEARGAKAGEAIAARFNPRTTQDPLYPEDRLILTWANHRFVRFRSFLSALEIAAARFSANWKSDCERAELPATDPRQTPPGLGEMIAQRAGRGLKKTGYSFNTNAQAELAEKMVAAVRELADLADKSAAGSIDHHRGKATSPRPKPRLFLRPAGEADSLAERR